MSRVAGISMLVVIAAVATAVGYHLSRDRAPAPATARTMPASTVPEVRPLFSLQDAEGRSRQISEWDGRPLLINFWATWCAPCRREIPLLNQLRAERASAGFEVIGIAVDFRDDVIAYMRDTPVDYPVLIGEQEGLDVARAFGMETMGFPFTVFTDRQGRIVTVHVGELHGPQAEVILAAVEDVDSGRVDIEAARAELRSSLAHLKAEET